MIRLLRLRSLLLVVLEALMIFGAVAAAAYVRLGEWAWDILRYEHGLEKTAVVALVAQTCLYYADLYNLRLVSDRRELFVRIVRALGAASFILAAIYFWFPALIIGRGVFAFAAGFSVLLIIGWRFLFDLFCRRIAPGERLLLVGTNAAAVALARELFDQRAELGVDIVGFVDPDPERIGAPVLNPGVIGTIEDIPSIVRTRNVDRVVVSLIDARGKLPMDKLLEMKLDGVNFSHLPTVYEEYTGKIAVENLRPSWLIFSEGFRKGRVLLTAKRALDLVCAGIGLVLAAPLMLLIAPLIKMTSSGSVVYRQARVGLYGRIFTVYKFRSMYSDAEAGTGAVWAKGHADLRVTPLGRFLRRTRLDEMPQLWNVLRGEMSFIGPRPERPEFLDALSAQIPYYGQRHVVRPGITGWAQVRYTYGASVEDALQKLQYDLYYIKHLSIALDLFIILETVKTVILRRGA